jgi:primase-like protein/bifunctional DNA primase/polymerase-like protein/uncharacterized protein DUF3987
MGEMNYMAAFGARLIANGYSILPIAPGTKKPGRYRSGSWGEFPGWPQYGERCPTDLELITWSKWPGAGIGVVGGSVAAVDIDIVDDPDLALQVEKLCREHLGDSPALRIGRAPKRLLVFRTATPFKGIKRHPLEVLCLGQQFVAYAVHPDTGAPYIWPEEGLADLDIDSLPEITEAQALAFLDAAMALIPERLRPVRLETGASDKPAAGLAQEGTILAIKSALAWLPNADLDYDSWMRIGMALKGALGEAGADLFASWSAQAGKNDPAFTDKSWAGFNPTRIGAGTIYHLAMERGWKPDAALVLDGSIEPETVHPAAGLLAAMSGEDESGGAQEASSDWRPEQSPFSLTIPPGLIGELTDYMLKTARRPQPLLSLGASLCAVGALMGRNYRTESNLRSNLYIVGVADSGSGKNHSREIVNELFVAAGLSHHLGGNKIASGSGLLTAVHRQPAILFQIDEFGMFLAAAADRRKSPRHITDILDNMTELYTAAGGIFLGAEYANRDGQNDRKDINQPCVCVYGTTTPLHFWGALQGANVVDGSLARFIVLPTEDDYPEENTKTGQRRASRFLIKGLSAIAKGGARQRRGNLVGKATGLESVVDPMVVPMEREARDIFHALSQSITTDLRQAKGTTFTPILARIAENAQKIALVLAVGRNPETPRINTTDANWAIGFVRHFAERTMLDVERHVADNETDRNHKRVREILRKAGKAGLTLTEVVRKTQYLEKRRRDEILATLVEAKQIKMAQQPSTTKPAMVYRSQELTR